MDIRLSVSVTWGLENDLTSFMWPLKKLMTLTREPNEYDNIMLVMINTIERLAGFPFDQFMIITNENMTLISTTSAHIIKDRRFFAMYINRAWTRAYP